MDFAPALFKHPARTRAARGRPARDEIGSARARASREEPTARMASVAMPRLWCTDAVAVSTDMTVCSGFSSFSVVSACPKGNHRRGRNRNKSLGKGVLMCICSTNQMARSHAHSDVAVGTVISGCIMPSIVAHTRRHHHERRNHEPRLARARRRYVPTRRRDHHARSIAAALLLPGRSPSPFSEIKEDGALTRPHPHPSRSLGDNSQGQTQRGAPPRGHHLQVGEDRRVLLGRALRRRRPRSREEVRPHPVPVPPDVSSIATPRNYSKRSLKD